MRRLNSKPSREALVRICESYAVGEKRLAGYPQTRRALCARGFLDTNYRPTKHAWEWLVLVPENGDGETLLRASGERIQQAARIALHALRQLRRPRPEGWATRDHWYEDNAEGMLVVCGHAEPYVREEWARRMPDGSYAEQGTAGPRQGTIRAVRIYPPAKVVS